jgi:stage V sporulation protein G
MDITEVKIRKVWENESKLAALLSVTIGNEFVIHDIKIIRGNDRLFVAMPSRRDESGAFHDIAHPISQQSRKAMEETILKEYYNSLNS